MERAPLRDMPAKGQKWKQLERLKNPRLISKMSPQESGRLAGLKSAEKRKLKKELEP